MANPTPHSGSDNSTSALPWRAYLELTKPRILGMVLISAVLGFVLGASGLEKSPFAGGFSGMYWLTLGALLIGTALVSGGAAALNHLLERDADARMERTRRRPIPAGQIAPADALGFGVSLVLAGVLFLAWQVNLLTAFLALLTAFLYVMVYTPLKRLTWLNTLIGAIPGAIPPMGGWAAATGGLDWGAWALFGILFIWQQPHFYAIAWMCADDYRRGGFQMLPSLRNGHARTIRQIVFFLALLLPVSALPVVLGVSSVLYLIGAVVLGAWFLGSGLTLARTRSMGDARNVLMVSVLYLPLLLGLIVVDFALF